MKAHFFWGPQLLVAILFQFCTFHQTTTYKNSVNIAKWQQETSKTQFLSGPCPSYVKTVKVFGPLPFFPLLSFLPLFPLPRFCSLKQSQNLIMASKKLFLPKLFLPQNVSFQTVRNSPAMASPCQPWSAVWNWKPVPPSFSAGCIHMLRNTHCACICLTLFFFSQRTNHIVES